MCNFEFFTIFRFDMVINTTNGDIAVAIAAGESESLSVLRFFEKNSVLASSIDKHRSNSWQ